MRSTTAFVLGILIAASPILAGEPLALKTEKDKMNYGIGAMTVRNLRLQGVELDLELVIQGMRDELAAGRLLITEVELRRTMSWVQAAARQKRMQTMKTSREKDAKKQDVVTLPGSSMK